MARVQETNGNLTSPESRILNPESLPKHIAIIMDGNGRWAKARKLPRIAGHKKGADSLRTIIKACRTASIQYLTIYAFSAENWKRPPDEIDDLMKLLGHYLQVELSELHRNNIRLRFIGDLTLLKPDMFTMINDAMTLTAQNNAFNLTVALSYGSRQEIVRTARKLADDVANGKIRAQDITEERFSESLDTAGMPAPDLLIRTGGEQRLSNFLLWQSAYAEFYFTPVLWPDFNDTHFGEALKAYSHRERRYGTTGQ